MLFLQNQDNVIRTTNTRHVCFIRIIQNYIKTERTNKTITGRHVYSYRCGGGLTVTASKQTPLPVTGTIPLTGPVGYRSAKNLTGYRGLTGGMDGVGRGGDMNRFYIF